jgi:hypothetical protein
MSIGRLEVAQNGKGLLERVDRPHKVTLCSGNQLPQHCQGCGFALDIPDWRFQSKT